MENEIESSSTSTIAQEIYTFWYNNPKYWIVLKDYEKIDKLIYDKFHDVIPIPNKYYKNKVEYLAYVIYNDQFYRHFYRHLKLDLEDYIYKCRSELELILDPEYYITLDNIELYFALMPFKHLKNYKFVLDILSNRNLDDHLTKFYMDTLEKYSATITYSMPVKIGDYNLGEICEYYPFDFKENWFLDNKLKTCTLSKILEKTLDKHITYTISLSGGVDSMVIISLLKLLDYNVVALHIVYGNRETSQMECQFIRDFCEKIDVPLYVHEIEYLRRGKIDRDFYERVTRNIRFKLYRDLGNPVLTGHILEDVIENIWTNISKCQHLSNLDGMKFNEICDGVNIIRPFLKVSKSQVYNVSRELEIPYLKNTTPSWSNRGKFRTRFYQETHTQFGTTIDNKILEFSEHIRVMTYILNQLVYKPIIDSFTIDNKILFKQSLDLNSWMYIFETVCHTKLGINKPSIHSVRQFMDRIGRKILGKNIKVVLHKNLYVIVDDQFCQFHKI
jgi:tRNA(Ile)-lysidine synthetase-like protein